MRAESSHPDWTMETELLADTVEGLSTLSVLFVKAWSKQGARAPDPITIPRPWDADTSPRIASRSEMRRFFGGRVRYTPKAPTAAELVE